MSTLLIFLLTDVGFYSYDIIRKLGEGGFGSIYAGIRLTDGLQVSLLLHALSIKVFLHSYTTCIIYQSVLALLYSILLYSSFQAFSVYLMFTTRAPDLSDMFKLLDMLYMIRI